MVNDQNGRNWDTLPDKEKLDYLREACQDLNQRVRQQQVLIQELFAKLEKAAPRGGST